MANSPGSRSAHHGNSGSLSQAGQFGIWGRLSAMMFVQFFIWGAWYVTAYPFLVNIGFGPDQIKWTYSVGPIAGMISPFFVGMFADRFFATERVLGVLHLLAAGAMFAAIKVIEGSSGTVTLVGISVPVPTVVNLLFFAHMLCYFPTLSLTNSLALHNVTNSEKQFPLIRVFGTIGWIVAGVAVTWQAWDAAVQMFHLAAYSGLFMGLYCFTLPHTPPPAAGKQVRVREVLGLDALVLLKRPAFLTFMVCSFLICIPLAFYYQMAANFVKLSGVEGIGLTMSTGQMSEILFMVVMPFFFVRLGVKWMLFVGMLAWVVRYALFALGAPEGIFWLILPGILLHGICYDFFFVTGQIYTDKVAPPQIRGQAQGMLVLFTLGLGMLIGAQAAGWVEGTFTTDEGRAHADQAHKLFDEIVALNAKIDTADEQSAAALRGQRDQLRDQRREPASQALPEWRMVWAIPAVGAAAVLVLFTLVFRDDTRRTAVGEGQIARAAAREELP